MNIKITFTAAGGGVNAPGRTLEDYCIVPNNMRDWRKISAIAFVHVEFGPHQYFMIYVLTKCRSS